MAGEPEGIFYVGTTEEAVDLVLRDDSDIAQALGRLHCTGIDQIMEAYWNMEVNRDTKPSTMVMVFCTHAASMVGSILAQTMAKGHEEEAVKVAVSAFTHQLQMFISHGIPELKRRGLLD